MNAGAPQKRHAQEPAGCRRYERNEGSREQHRERKALCAKIAGGTPALRANFCRAYGAGLVLLSGCHSVGEVRVTSHSPTRHRFTSYELRRFGFVGFFVFDVALGVGVDGVLVGVG